MKARHQPALLESAKHACLGAAVSSMALTKASHRGYRRYFPSGLLLRNSSVSSGRADQLFRRQAGSFRSSHADTATV